MKVWKYMSFTQYISFLETGSLYFPSLEQLRNDDPHEGAENLTVQAMIDTDPDTKEFYEHWRKSIRVNCWHMNEHESYAMWKIYLKGTDGIALQTTEKKLKEVFQLFPGVQVDRVTYRTPESSNKVPFYLAKRMEYSYENELRIFYEAILRSGESSIDVEINKLVDCIYVSPWAPHWFFQLVESISNKYKVTSKISQSCINKSTKETFLDKAGVKNESDIISFL